MQHFFSRFRWGFVWRVLSKTILRRISGLEGIKGRRRRPTPGPTHGSSPDGASCPECSASEPTPGATPEPSLNPLLVPPPDPPWTLPWTLPGPSPGPAPGPTPGSSPDAAPCPECSASMRIDSGSDSSCAQTSPDRSRHTSRYVPLHCFTAPAGPQGRGQGTQMVGWIQGL